MLKSCYFKEKFPKININLKIGTFAKFFMTAEISQGKTKNLESHNSSLMTHLL